MTVNSRASRFQSRVSRAGARTCHSGLSIDKDVYDRLRDLPALIPAWPAEIEDFSPEGTLKLLHKLKNALRAERARGLAGHWAYDLERHLKLAIAHKAEELQYCASCSGENRDAAFSPRPQLRRRQSVAGR